MKVKIDEIKQLSYKILSKLGINENQINIIINSYLEADLCGVSTHGFNTFPEHIKKFIKGVYPLKPNIKTVKEEVSFSVIDANSSIGPLAADFAMRLSVEKAKKVGIYTSFVRNANTFGPAFVYNNIALENKMIGIIFSNSPAQMAPINGVEKLIGTNPIAISIPANNEKPIVYDIATSEVAKSKIKQAAVEGRDIPVGWATDEKGNPTTDPNEAIKGLILPMSGYKGYGLAMCIDILSGLISGAAFLNDVGRFYGGTECMNVGFTVIAIDPVRIFNENFFNKVDEYIERICHSKVNSSGNKISIPGENRIREKEKNLIDGIELNKETIDKLMEYEKEL